MAVSDIFILINNFHEIFMRNHEFYHNYFYDLSFYLYKMNQKWFTTAVYKRHGNMRKG